MDKVAGVTGQMGYLQLNEDGAVLTSSGDLQNDESTAGVIMGLLSLTQSHQIAQFPDISDENKDKQEPDGFKRMCINYDDHAYVVCFSNRKVHIVKIAKNISPTQ